MEQDEAKLHAYYAENGFLVIASVELLSKGPIEENDWNEDEMCEYRWSVVGEATREDLVQQNRILGHTNPIGPSFRYYYRVVAMD